MESPMVVVALVEAQHFHNILSWSPLCWWMESMFANLGSFGSSRLRASF